MQKGREYLTTILGWQNVTDYEISAIVLLLYHSFGPSKSREMDKTSQIYIAL